jgi:Domain of unknown function (DUF1932)
VKQHGVRRAAEMREASRMMAEFGLDGSLAQAIAARHESFGTPKTAASESDMARTQAHAS